MADNKIIRTDNIPLLDNVVHYLKIMATECVLKNQTLADSKETIESRKNFDIYKMCKLNTVRYSYFDYTLDDLMNTNVPKSKMYDILVDKFNADDNIREELLKNKKESIINNYIELNDYYRMLNGEPDINDTDNIYIDSIYLTDDDFIVIDPNIPVHLMTQSQQDFLYSIGVLDIYIEMYPKKKYLKFLGSRKIDPFTARMTREFGMLYMPTDGIPMEVHTRWKEKFNMNRAFTVKTIYDKEAFIDENYHYDNFIAMFIIIQTMVDIISELPDFIIKRDIFDLGMIRLILQCYDVDYFPDIPLNYQKAIVRNINKLIEFKSTTTSIVNICSLFGCDNIEVFKYYLFKERKLDDQGKFIFNEDEKDNYKFKFIKCPIDGNIDDYIHDQSKYLSYNNVTFGDKYWDGGLLHKYVEDSIKEHSFNYLQSKYLSIDCIFSMTEILFQLVYFYNMLFDDVFSEDLLRVRIFNISNRYSFKLVDVFCFLFALGYTYYGLEDDLLFDESKILYVKGFNFKLSMSELGEYINKKHYTLEELGVEDFVTFEPTDRILTFSQLSSIFINNKKIYNHVVHEMLHASNKRIYDIYKYLYDAMMTSELTSTFFTKSDGSVAKTFTDFLEDRDSNLYNALMEIKSLDEYADRQQAASTMINDVIYVLEHQYLTDEAFSKIYRCFPTADANSIITYIKELINFFKSYKVQIDQINIIYLLDDQYENWCGAIDDVILKIYLEPTANGESADDFKPNIYLNPQQKYDVNEDLSMKVSWSREHAFESIQNLKDDSFYNTKINKTLLDEHSCWDSLDIIVKTYE